MNFMNIQIESLVRHNHELRKIGKLVSWAEIAKGFVELKSECGRLGYGVECGIRSLFVQFYYDLSDREMENRLRDDVAVQWFCGFKLHEQTPDHSFFGRMRETLGTRRIGKIFKRLLRASEHAGILRNVFSFVDSSTIESKQTTWAERDKALSQGETKLNNKNVECYGADRDARFGNKGKDKFWYGYKRHVSVDMGSGLIKKTAATAANETDDKAFEKVCPEGGMVFADKAYCLKNARSAMRLREVHSGAILKNNMRGKNQDKDRWLSRMRAPFENVFSKMRKRAKFRGLEKIQAQCFWEAITFNLRRLLILNAPPLKLAV